MRDGKEGRDMMKKRGGRGNEGWERGWIKNLLAPPTMKKTPLITN